MRRFIFIILIFISSAAIAEGFTVFEKDGYFGIKDETGNVTVPAVYEQLGWSDGSSQVYGDVIGFRSDRLWGLITVRNKALTGQKFYSIVPLQSGYFKASIKGRFSNHLFHGILDQKGKTVISFNYFSITSMGANWLVSSFNGKEQEFGVVSYNNELIVPTKYISIKEKNQLIIGKKYDQKLDLYQSDGQLLQLGLDSLINQNGWIGYRDGYAGYLSKSGKEVYSFDYKKFTIEESSVKAHLFPEWTVYKHDTTLLKWRCDSLSVSGNGMLVAFLNGAHHLLLKNNLLLNNHELILKEVHDDQLIVQNSKSRKWSVLNESGKEFISGYDSIHSIGGHYGCLADKGWFLITQDGEELNRLPLQALRQGLKNQFLVKKNNHWGIFNRSDLKQPTYKYDSITCTGREYIVSYLNRWGVLNEKEEWIIRSEYSEVISFGALLVGRRGKGYTFYYDGEALYKTISRPIKELGELILIADDSTKFGLISRYGELVKLPQYDSIRLWSDYYELIKNGTSTLMTASSKLILKEDEDYQEVNGFGEGYFVVRKENRWGFVDSNGLLRISNRYNDAQPFNDGYAAIKLRGKWGFIDKSERIKIQPYYDEVSTFDQGRAIVRQGDRFGLLDSNGKEVLELIWKDIHRLRTGNYLVRDINDKIGLVDKDGSFVFRPSFDRLEDFGDRVLVSKNGYSGILNYSRYPIFKINHEEIKVIREFTMVKN